MLNIVVPMAGLGSRFAKAGYKDPKPFIDVLGRPMITRVISNLMPLGEHQFYFVCLKDHLTRFPLEKLLKESCLSVKILPINSLTQGPACTVLEAKDFINNDEPLMVANCDQFIEVYPAHLKEQEFPFRGTTLICSEYRCRPVLKISSTFQEIRFKNQGFMKTVSLLNLIH